MSRRWLAALGAGLVVASAASADTFNLVGSSADSTEGLCNFSALLEYNAAADGLSGILTVSIENTTDPAIGGKLTGFLFNHASTDSGATVTLLPGSTHPAFKFAKGNGQPFGMNYKAGAALGGNWQGGGNPNPGISVGHIGEFSFLVTANDAGSLSAADFASGPHAFNFVVRFRGLDDGGSDKVPGVPSETPPPPPTFCICDFNQDGVVDGDDLDLIFSAWEICLNTPGCSAEQLGFEIFDLNGDGIISELDFKLFLLCWIECEDLYAD